MLKDKRVVVVLPTYNESGSIAQLIDTILGLSPLVTVLVVDDNSPDGTGGVIRRMVQQFPDRLHLISRPSKLGFASACFAGLREALKLQAECIVSMDADLSHNPEDIPRLVEAAARHGLVIGSRYLPGASSQDSGWHYMLSRNGNRYVRTILSLDSTDCTSGFRAYRSETLSRICSQPLRSTGFAFLVELLDKVTRTGDSVGEIPIKYRAREAGKSKMSGWIVIESILLPWQLLLSRWSRSFRLRGGNSPKPEPAIPNRNSLQEKQPAISPKDN